MTRTARSNTFWQSRTSLARCTWSISGEIVNWGAEAPAWAYSRWVREQAYRWLLIADDPRIENVLLTTVIAAYADLDPERPMGGDPHEFFTRIAGSDWICEQLAVYEYGGLADFIDVRASDELLARTDRIEDWYASAVGGFTLDDLAGDRLLVTELAGNRRFELLNLGAMSDRGSGAAVLGRVVPDLSRAGTHVRRPTGRGRHGDRAGGRHSCR